ncbi:hypothetical protein ACFSLT_28720 [Novosphingobium resinovorum]
MTNDPANRPSSRLPAEHLAALRAQIAQVQAARGPVLPFGLLQIDTRLASGGLDGAALHEIAAPAPAGATMLPPPCLPQGSPRALLPSRA